jgi:hypothetical protein
MAGLEELSNSYDKKHHELFLSSMSKKQFDYNEDGTRQPFNTSVNLKYDNKTTFF